MARSGSRAFLPTVHIVSYYLRRIIGQERRRNEYAGTDLKGHMKGRTIHILARNIPPIIPCGICREPAISICMQCIYEDKGRLCNVCAKNHKCGQEIPLPVVNSPRAGVCGYTGKDPAYIW